MNATTSHASLDAARLRKKVPTLYEADTSRYVGPHPWQIQPWARVLRRAMRHHAYGRWAEQAFSHVDVKGAELLERITGPCVFVANHQSHLDTVIVNEALPDHIRANLYFGAAQDRWFVKGKKKLILQPWYQSLAMGNFPIMRGGGKGALSYADWLLKRGRHVFLFPEGTRATGVELGEFKHGATLLALENDVQIVPIYLGGLQGIRPKGSRDVARGAASIEILAPLHFSTGSDVERATATVRERLNRVHQNAVARLGATQIAA